MSEQIDNPLSPNKQALLAIRELKRKLAECQQSSGEPIAIVSMACRFPRRSRTPEQFWQCLLEGTDEASEIPDSRWDLEAFFDEDPEVPGKMYARKGVFLEDLDMMDPEFFGISPREATWVDPQQRLLMEVGWEAIERAGWRTDRIGEQTGVFVGWMHNDYQNEASDSFLNLNPYIATGAAGSFLCGRLAYFLGLQGPSVAVDTACSSSLVALHLACQSLQRGDCHHALVGGVNAIVSPTTNILTCKLKALSPLGHSRAFDAAADGYLRGEGCGVVTLRRLSDAQRDGDPILGVIRGSSVGHNGSGGGLTVPNPKAQEKVIREAIARAGIDHRQVAYLEAHGTGTELGDPVELKAATAALTAGRGPQDSLLVGSVKTNIGHLEAAAGIAGLIKVLLALQHGRIPGQLNFENPNPHIPWETMPIKVVTEATDWPNLGDRRLAGVSAFGMSGTNAHVVVEAPDNGTKSSLAVSEPRQEENRSPREEPSLLVISGKNDEALQQSAENLQREFVDQPELNVFDAAYTTCVGRSHFENRAALVVRDREHAGELLKMLSRSARSEGVYQGNGRKLPKVAWQFTGQGAQYLGMGRGLYKRYPIFRDAIDHCHERLSKRREASLLDVLFSTPELINHTSWTQPCIFAVQMGLVKLLESWDIRPNVVLGHSVGQYAAACTAGIMSWEDGLHLIGERGRLIGELPEGGRMLAVFADLGRVQEIADGEPELSVAAMNGSHIVISGPSAAVARAEARLESTGIRAKALTTSHAFHSALMDPALEPFRAVAEQVSYQAGQLPLICNVSGKPLAADAVLDGAYWANHIRQPVRFADGVDAAQELGCDIILELGPQSVLTRMAAANWRQVPEALFSCLQREGDDVESLLQAMGQLFVQGLPLDFDAIYADRNCRRVVLPTYPFQRRKFWGPDKPGAFHSAHHTSHPLLGEQVSLAGVKNETRFESHVEPESPRWLPDHQVMGQVVMPGAAFVEMALAGVENAILEDIRFEQPLHLSSRTTLQCLVRKGKDERDAVEVYSQATGSDNWNRHFSARATKPEKSESRTINRAGLEARCREAADPAEFYSKLQELGLHYGPEFQTVSSLRYSESEVLAHLRTKSDTRGFTLTPTLLDGALHSLAVGLLRDDEAAMFLPVGMGKVSCSGGSGAEIWCHARWNENEGKIRTADLVLFDEQGRVVAEIDGLKVQQIERSAFQKLGGSGIERLVHELSWQAYRLPAPTTEPKKWILIDSGGKQAPLVSEVAQRLTDQKHPVRTLNLQSQAEFSQDSDDAFTFDGESAEHWAEAFRALSEQASYTPDGICWFVSDNNTDSEQEPLGAAKSECTGLLHLLTALREAGVLTIECGLQLVTTDAMAAEQADCTVPQQTQYWGLGRVIGAELGELHCRLIDLASKERQEAGTATAVADILITETSESQFLVRDQRLLVPRLRKISARKDQASAFQAKTDSSYLITGGLGKLGRHAAKWLAEHGAGEVVLVSRRAPDEETQAFLEQVEALGCRTVIHAASISAREDVASLFARFGNDLLPLAGVIHAAGVLDDGLLADQTWERFQRVLAPKVIGASLLNEFTQALHLDFFILYSSAASVLGSPGQGNYATGNAFLDGLAWQRLSQGLPATSINWGPWTEGMADDERILKRMALQGIAPLSVSDANEAMQRILASQLPQATVIDVDWRRMGMGLGSQAPAMLENLVPSTQGRRGSDSELVTTLKKLPEAEQRQFLLTAIQDMLQGILSSADAPETDRPLIEMGLDSLMAVEFGTELQKQVGDQVAVGPTMFFEHPSIDAITDHVLELITADVEEAGETADATTEGKPEVKPVEREDVAIIGMSCRFPGARSVDQYWQNLLDGVDSVCEVPADRWDIDRFYDENHQPGKMVSREGGFLDDIGDFDAEFFSISPQEACWIDPQHRMLLENSYHALEHAGIATEPMADSNVGVFMGIMGQDYAFLPKLEDRGIIEAFQGAGLSHSAGVGRISYVFGFEGPSVAVDTASSSSLVAVLQAVRSLQDGNCNMALAGGVNAILAPVNSLLMSKAGLLAPDGRCKSFSAGANGFGRGEGCGVVVLKRVSDAQRDGDNILAVIRGGAVVHNGASGGITSPSGRSQSRMISEALEDAGIAPSQVQYLEAHGTGTELGDAMEIGAAASVYGKGRSADQPLLVGSAKANISHLEAAGGVSGLIKTVLAMEHGVVPRQVHLEQPTPHVPWDRLPVKVVREQTPWIADDERIAGVTALGLVGTNAHVILSAQPAHVEPDAAEVEESRDDVLLLSAKSETALAALVERYREFLRGDSAAKLADLCRSAAEDRRHFEHRLALVGSSCEELSARLSSLAHPPEPESKNGTFHTNGAHSATMQPETTTQTSAAKPPRISWIFSGTADDSLDCAKELYREEPLFRELMEAFEERLSSLYPEQATAPVSIVDWLESRDTAEGFGEAKLFVLQAGVASVWRSWGIEPDAVTGFGIGQYTAACVAGGLCFKDALSLIVERQNVLQALRNANLPLENAVEENSLDSDVIAELDRFETFADSLNYYPPNLPLVCSLSGEVVPVHRSLGGSYWRRHCLELGTPAEALQTFINLDADFYLEIGPADTVVDIEELVNLRRGIGVGETARRDMLEILADLYMSGANLKYAGLHQDRNGRRIRLPNYPFQKKRYWITEIADHVEQRDEVLTS